LRGIEDGRINKEEFKDFYSFISEGIEKDE